MLLAKHLMQCLWLANVGWDSTAPHVKCHGSTISIPHCIIQPRANSAIELHGFTDSSEKGYAAVIYLRIVSVSGVVSTRLLLAKSKVAPLKKVTLPCLELCTALILARLQTVIEAYASALSYRDLFRLLHTRGNPLWLTMLAKYKNTLPWSGGIMSQVLTFQRIVHRVASPLLGLWDILCGLDLHGCINLRKIGLSI
ncbi:hypothetical protein PR048_000636 [Dryococelus australis]|uniref:Secreted protein n=1 Tax=Dryococelus australis TaxID=614101 RepID=A0ABQ9IG37_9NEOP|nr:hypothetical protein PR048_000636 [Dryococelus australis]